MSTRSLICFAFGALLLIALQPSDAQRNSSLPARAVQALSPRMWSLFPRDAQLEVVGSGFGFTEGPVWSPAGFLFVSDEEKNAVYRLFPDGRREQVIALGDPDGSTLDDRQQLIVCASVLRSILRLSPDGKSYAILAERFDGKRFNSPNDIVTGPDGSLYFTDPTLDLVRGEKQELAFKGVYRLDRNGKVTLLSKDMDQPNGLAFSPNGRFLYVDDTARRNIWRYRVHEDGSLSEGTIFGDEAVTGEKGVPDGMKVDTEGNLYVVGPRGVWVWNPSGEHLGTVLVPQQPANLAWGGPGNATLFITAGTSVYCIRTRVMGFVAHSKKKAALHKRVGTMMRQLLSATALGLLILAAPLHGQASSNQLRCTVRPVSYQGWDAQEVSNPWVKLTFVPRLGGRLMQVAFEGHPYLFVNPTFRGKYVSPAEAKGAWINYGGDKIWPMPEGDSDEHHWVLASTAIDDLPYEFKALSQGDRCAVQLTGQPDVITGLQYERTIRISADSPQIDFHAVMRNATTKPIMWSVQSVSQYDLGDPGNAADYNHELWAYTPVNPQSSYPDGFHVRSGLADDPSFSLANGIFRLHWMYFENEVWLDSQAGWLTVFDKGSQYGMVERFAFDRKGDYPGKATVIFYKNGPAVSFDKQGRASLPVTTIAATPYYMEAEINSPIVSLPPGGTYAMDTTWNPVRMKDPPSSMSASGVVNQRLRANRHGSLVTVAGEITPFRGGTPTLIWLGKNQTELSRHSLKEAGPDQSLILNGSMPLPKGATHLQLVMLAGSESKPDVLDEATIDGEDQPGGTLR